MKPLLLALILLASCTASAQCYNPSRSFTPPKVLAVGNLNYNKGFIGNSAGIGIAADRITVSAHYIEWKRDSARQSFGLLITHEVWGNEKLGTSILIGAGTNKYTEAGFMVAWKTKTPLFIKLSTIGIGVGMWVKL
jgi:hypothetical protein